jgi:hypothetical protein
MADFNPFFLMKVLHEFYCITGIGKLFKYARKLFHLEKLDGIEETPEVPSTGN